MKNVIISALSAYIFYGFCEVKDFLTPVIMFLLVLVLLLDADDRLAEFRLSVRRGKRLSKKIDKMKEVGF